MGDARITLSLRLRGGKGRVRGASPNFDDEMVAKSKFTHKYLVIAGIKKGGKTPPFIVVYQV